MNITINVHIVIGGSAESITDPSYGTSPSGLCKLRPQVQDLNMQSMNVIMRMRVDSKMSFVNTAHFSVVVVQCGVVSIECIRFLESGSFFTVFISRPIRRKLFLFH